MKVNEIFYSIQGEGRHTGAPAIFVRFALCNLHCPFCDTDFSIYKEMSEEEMVSEVLNYPATHIVITGGEPTLQLTHSFLKRLHENGRYIQIETNGTQMLSDDILREVDWVTCSPKFEYNESAEVKIGRIDELKVVYKGQDMSIYNHLAQSAQELYIQPCDTGDERKNNDILLRSIDFIKKNTQWKLSLQTQKILCVR